MNPIQPTRDTGKPTGQEGGTDECSPVLGHVYVGRLLWEDAHVLGSLVVSIWIAKKSPPGVWMACQGCMYVVHSPVFSWFCDIRRSLLGMVVGRLKYYWTLAMGMQYVVAGLTWG